MDNFQRTVGENIGYASMCWMPPPSGVFDSTQAQVAVDAIMAAHKAEIERLTAELAAAKHFESMWAEAQLDIVDLKAELAAAKAKAAALEDALKAAQMLLNDHHSFGLALTDTKE